MSPAEPLDRGNPRVTSWRCPRCGKTVRGLPENEGGNHRHRHTLTGWCLKPETEDAKKQILEG